MPRRPRRCRAADKRGAGRCFPQTLPACPHRARFRPPRQVEAELAEICTSILTLLDSALVPNSTSGESKVFYLKMKGDYHRYLAEFKTNADRKEEAESTLLAYKAAQVRAPRALSSPPAEIAAGPPMGWTHRSRLTSGICT